MLGISMSPVLLLARTLVRAEFDLLEMDYTHFPL